MSRLCGGGADPVKALAANAVVTLAILLALLAAVARDPKPLALHVSPLIATAPADWTLRVWVEAPQADDAAIVVWTDGAQFSRASAWEADGRRLYDGIRWRGIPAGDFTVYASVRDRTGHQRATDSQHITVTGF